MFKYFNRESNEMKYTVPYKERLKKRTKEICQGINCTEEDMINLETLARMSVPEEKLKIESVKRISKYSADYEEFIRARFFRGLSPEEFENDESIMLEFNFIKSQVKKDFMNKTEKYFSYMVPMVDETFEEYAKRVFETINNKKSKEYDNIEDYYLISNKDLLNLLSFDFEKPKIINEELVDLYALKNAICEEELLLTIFKKYQEQIKHVYLQLTMDKSIAVLLVYGYNLMHTKDIYDSFLKNKSIIYSKFNNTYEKINELKKEIKDDGNKTADHNIEFLYKDYEELPMREKMVKPIYNPGKYATFYATPDQMQEYLDCKVMSRQFADSILNHGIKDFSDALSYTLECYADTEDENSIRHAINGVAKELRRKDNKISNKKIKDIEKVLKSI